MVCPNGIAPWLLLPGLLLGAGCASELGGSAHSESRSAEATELPVVDVAIARLEPAADSLRYTGTTRPVQDVSLTSRVEGQLLTLSADVGDRVARGQEIARLDDDLLVTAVREAESELAARRYEVDRVRAELAETRARVEQARATLQQARADAERLQRLQEDGAISTQDAEIAVTEQRTSEQVLRSAEEQVRTRERAIASAEQRVAAQQAIVEQMQERLSFARLDAPLSGTVLTKTAELGDIVQPGDAILTIGDLSEVHVYVDISDRDRSRVRLDQRVDVTLDAFPGETFAGRVTQISPVADAAARLIPVEVTIPNPEGAIGSGLLARVHIDTNAPPTLSVPASALAVGGTGDDPEASEGTIFAIVGDAETPTVEPRAVQLGSRRGDRVEIVSGLVADEAYVVDSERSLEPGQTVRRSVLSETAETES